jgi:DNA-binding CsgD family transcriptional regulator
VIVHPEAVRLLDTVAAGPRDPLRAVIVAPGGFGKSTVLGAVERVYLDAGVEVRDVKALGYHAGVVLIDDADQLGESQLGELRELAARGLPRLVLAHRPRPRSANLLALTEDLARDTRQVVLSPLDLEQLDRFVTESTGERPSAKTVAALYAATGGVPRFVERMIAAGPDELGARAVEQFRAELDGLDEDVLRFLIASEAGAGRNLDLLCALLDRDRAGVSALIDDARATGMLSADDSLPPIAKLAVRTLTAVDRRLDVLQRLVELQLRQRQPVLELAKSLLGTGTAGVSVAAGFEAAATEALPADPALAATFFAAAADAGRRSSTLTSGWARAAALSGDLDTALRLSDELLAADDPSDRAMGATVAATVLGHRGELGRSAELYQWSEDGYSTSLAAVGLIGIGKPVEANDLLAAPAPRSVPTLLTGAAARMAEGVRESVSGSATEALSNLLGAAAMLEPAATAVLLPDSPAALAAIVALHCGELRLAESVLNRVLSAERPDPFAARHRLLLGWTFMVSGDLGGAAAQAAAVREATPTPEPRDELFLTTLELGLARRASDIPGTRRNWENAYQAAMRHPVDLFMLLPLGELAITAARLGEHARISRHLEQAGSLLAALGNPPLWTAPLIWSGLHAAITREDNASAEAHVVLLEGLAGSNRYCVALFGAAKSWLAVLAGEVDAVQVAAAADELHEIGLCWDAARLAGQAAIRTSDRKAMVMLLEAARQFQGTSAQRQTSPVEAADVSALSEREQEVARLVVDGLTYKQAGNKLFISGKTVEHHMARIRAKLGANDRRELLGTLRELLDTPGGPRPPA